MTIFSLELITRLNTKHQQYQMGRGGTTELTWDAIAGAMAGLSSNHTILINLLRDNAREYERLAFRSWISTVIKQRIVESGDKPRRGLSVDQVVDGITTIVLYSYLNAAGHCDHCGGDGVVQSISEHKLDQLAKKYMHSVNRKQKIKLENPKMAQCEYCDGSGVKPWPYKARLHMAGWASVTSPVGPVKPRMTEDSYRMTWAKHERHAMALLKLMAKQAEDWILLNLGLVDDDQDVLLVD